MRKALRTSRAWMLKELAMEMWESRDREAARKIFEAWYSWAIRSRLEPIKRVARMIKRHLEGVLNAIAAGITNAHHGPLLKGARTGRSVGLAYETRPGG